MVGLNGPRGRARGSGPGHLFTLANYIVVMLERKRVGCGARARASHVRVHVEHVEAAVVPRGVPWGALLDEAKCRLNTILIHTPLPGPSDTWARAPSGHIPQGFFAGDVSPLITSFLVPHLFS